MQQSEASQAGGRQARDVPLLAHHDDAGVEAGNPGDASLAAGVEPPLEDVPADGERAGHLALGDPLFERPDVDEDRPVRERRQCCLGAEAGQPAARLGQEVVDPAPGERLGELVDRADRPAGSERRAATAYTLGPLHGDGGARANSPRGVRS